jgi:hypothetical protein
MICGHYGAQIDDDPSAPVENHKARPACGSNTHLICINIHETITVHELLRLKDRTAGGSRPFMEQVVGDDLHRKSGKWMKLQRVIDRVKKPAWYSEVITDPETGDVVHKCEEPLSEHRGHGSAKRRHTK